MDESTEVAIPPRPPWCGRSDVHPRHDGCTGILKSHRDIDVGPVYVEGIVIEHGQPVLTDGAAAQMHVDAVLALVASRQITDEQADALNRALLARNVEQAKAAFSQFGDALKTLGGGS